MKSSSGTEAKAQVKTYFASLPPDSRRWLQRLRQAIRAAAPRSVDSFNYGIPGFRLDGQPLVSYAAWKAHASLYPLQATMREALGDNLKNYKTLKGTIQFPLDEPVPSTVVRRLVKVRIGHLRAGKR